jgi:hypothetical protein
MEMDDNDFYVVRKNLNILSVLILILAYTNAKIDSLNFLNIQIDLNGTKLYVAIFIGYLYFLWRFLTKLQLRSGFWNDFLQFYINSEEGVRSTHNEKRYRQELIDKSLRLKKAVEENEDFFRFVQLSIIRFKEWPLTKLRLSFTFTSTGSGNGEQPNFNVDHDITFSRFFFLRKLVSFCLKGDKFGDYLFPIIPVLGNIAFFIFKSGWQGSLEQLFLR